MTQVGERVGVYIGVTAENPNAIKGCGYGVYDGDLSGGPLGDFPNPRITLDNGEVIWGCQCWWGDEARIKERLEGYQKEGYTLEWVTAGTKGQTQ